MAYRSHTSHVKKKRFDMLADPASSATVMWCAQQEAGLINFGGCLQTGQASR
jgi:hypothetical protein